VLPSAELPGPAPSGHDRWARRLAATLLVGTGVALLALAKAWRGVEATLSAHAIAGLTGQTTIASPSRHLLILYRNSSVQSIFVLTGECSVAYLLATLFICAAPLMLLKQLSPVRTGVAITVAMSVLILVNVARLTAIGAAVSAWGLDPGLEIAHTYFGSLLTVVGTCAAGVAFAAVLMSRRKATQPADR
jgi:exosortase/archaeosortase family protein